MSYAINNLPSCITIGRETETAVTEIRIDCAEWLDRWPDMDVSVIVRTGRGAIYIPANLTMEGKTLVWCVDDVDTSILNKSTMEITGIAPDRHKLSEKVDILVDERLAGTTGETPDPMKPWVDRVIEAANTVGDARDDAVSAKDEAFDSANVAYKAAFDARESEKNAHASEQEAAQSANIAKDAEENTRATLVTVNGLAEYAKSSAEMAKESEEKSLQNANNAGTYATSAKESEIIARESGETAKTSAQSAQTSAGSAAESANQAKRSEEAAKGYADNTGEYARIATEKAQKATEQANSAGVSATSAEESANRASASEQNAATSAQEAKSSADSTKGYSESANEAAVNASDSAREAQVSAENAAASANNAEASKASAQVSAENARVSSQNAEDALQELRDKIASGEFKGEPGEPGKDAVVDATLTQSGQAADAKVTGDVVSQLKDDLSVEQSTREAADNAIRADYTNADEKTRRSLSALWKLNQGISYDFQTDAEEAYQKTVPSGAKLADVQSVGGKTVVWNQLLKNRTFDNTSNWHTENNVSLSVDNNVASVNSAIATNGIYQTIDNLKVSHKYYMSVELKSDIENYKVIYGSYEVTGINISQTITTNWCKYRNIKTCAIKRDKLFIYGSTIGAFDARNTLLIDLTQLFGSGNEPTDISDSRIAWIEQYAAAHPEYNAGELVSADVESVKYNDAIVAAIPSTVRSLPGYGWSAGSAANTIERTESGWKYIQRVGSVDLGSVNWERNTTTVEGKYRFIVSIPSIKDYTKNYINAKYVKVSSTNTATETGCIVSAKQFFVYDEAYCTTDGNTFKAAMSGVMLYYELSEPIITDITELMLDTLEPFDIEGGGTLTFTNAAQLPVPSSVEYLVSLAEVGV